MCARVGGVRLYGGGPGDAAATALVREWGVSQTTLEDVFLKLIRNVNPADAKRKTTKQPARAGSRADDTPQA